MKTRTTIAFIAALIVVGGLIVGTLRDPNFWRTENQRGDRLFRAGKFTAAAKTYTDPARIGIAQYRDGDFKAAAATFARVPGATGAFNQGNAYLMGGKYQEAADAYDRALGFRSGWKEAKENKALALARKAAMDTSGEGDEEAPDLKPDDIVFDSDKNENKGKPTEMAEGDLSDAELRATWLRQVQTTPADFLRAKFSYQAAKEEKQ